MKLNIQTNDIDVSPDWDYMTAESSHLAGETNLHELLGVLLGRIEALEAVIRTSPEENQTP